MDLSQAIEHALDGNAILFLGAGFSVGARNLRNKPIMTGGQLASHLARNAGIEEDALLEDAAEVYIEKFGKDRLIEELFTEFSARDVSKAHEVIAQVPWKTLYTTNYDNVSEVSYTRAGRKLSPLTLSDNIKNVARGDFTHCVHINGFIQRLNKNTLENEFKLTDVSYITSSLSNSPWMTKFRDDIRSARSVFFVGYSLQADLDIRRILHASDSLKEKCVFIIGSEPLPGTIRRARQFGTPFSLSTDEFSQRIGEVKETYIPRVIDFAGRSIVKVQLPTSRPKHFTDKLGFVKKQLPSMAIPARVDGVIPLRTNLMVNDIQGTHHFSRNLFASYVFSSDDMRSHGQSRLGFGVANVLSGNGKCS